MLIHNTNRVKGTAMPQKLENGNKTNETDRPKHKNEKSKTVLFQKNEGNPKRLA